MKNKKYFIIPLFIFFILITPFLNYNANAYSEIKLNYQSFYPVQGSHYVYYKEGYLYQPFAVCVKYYEGNCADYKSNFTFRFFVFKINPSRMTSQKIYEKDFNISTWVEAPFDTTVMFSVVNDKLIALFITRGEYIPDYLYPTYVGFGVQAIIFDTNNFDNYLIGSDWSFRDGDHYSGFTGRMVGTMLMNYFIIGFFDGGLLKEVCGYVDMMTANIMGGHGIIGAQQYNPNYGYAWNYGNVQYCWFYVYGGYIWSYFIANGYPASYTLSKFDLNTFEFSEGYMYNGFPTGQLFAPKISSLELYPTDYTPPPYVFPVSLDIGSFNCTFRVSGRITLDGQSYNSKCAEYDLKLGQNVTLNRNIYYVVDGNYFVGEWKGLSDLYQVWVDISTSPPTYYVVRSGLTGGNATSLNLNLFFTPYQRFWVTTGFQLAYSENETNTIIIRYGEQSRESVTPTSTPPNPFQPYQGSDEFQFLIHVIIPLVIVMLPAFLFYKAMGELGALIGLGVGIGLLYMSGYSPLLLVLILVLVFAVYLYRGRGYSPPTS